MEWIWLRMRFAATAPFNPESDTHAIDSHAPVWAQAGLQTSCKGATMAATLATPDVILTDKQLSNSAFSHVIHAPVEKVDIAGWLFSLPEAEYRRCCPPDHISCGATSSDEGVPMSINVEMIGQTLMIQHYVAEEHTPSLCRMVSTSDAFTPGGRTRVQVIWTLSVRSIDANSCEYTNSVVAHPTAEFMEFIARHNLSFEAASAARQHDGGDHNRRETPLFAASIERYSLNRR
jgi:hypothetical protein